MSLISHQVERLREFGKVWPKETTTRKMFLDAADTIETLAAKVRAQNLHGGWVSCDDAMPNHSDFYIVAFVEQHERCPYPHYYGLLEWNGEDEKWEGLEKLPRLRTTDTHEIIAWHPLPAFYKED